MALARSRMQTAMTETSVTIMRNEPTAARITAHIGASSVCDTGTPVVEVVPSVRTDALVVVVSAAAAVLLTTFAVDASTDVVVATVVLSAAVVVAVEPPLANAVAVTKRVVSAEAVVVAVEAEVSAWDVDAVVLDACVVVVTSRAFDEETEAVEAVNDAKPSDVD